MIELSDQQRRELRRTAIGELRLSDPESGQEYVILRADVYERLKHILSDDGDWTPDERMRLLAASGNRAGWNDPEMDSYNNYDESRKKLCP